MSKQARSSGESVYHTLIRRGQSKKKARELAMKYAQLVKFKAMPAGAGSALLTSSEALSAVRNAKMFENLKAHALKLNSRYRLTTAEAADFMIMWRNLLQNPFESTNRNATPFDALDVYCRLRFENGIKHPSSSKEFTAFAERIVPEKFKSTRRQNQGEGPGLREGVEITVDPLNFFRRVVAENGIRREANQLKGALLLFNDTLSRETSSGLLPFVRRGVAKVNSTLSRRELFNLSEEVKGWSRMNDTQRREIVRSRLLDRFGEELAERFEKILRDKMINRGMGEILGKDIEESEFDSPDAIYKQSYQLGGNNWPMYRWVISCLKRPGNRRKLAIAVVEGFPRHHSGKR